MSVALLEVNALLAPAWPVRNRRKGWAACPLTQLAFLRLSSRPAVVKAAIAMRDAQAVPAANVEARDREFWPLDCPAADALLLDLAIRKQGRLAALDLRIENLLAWNSPLRSRIGTLSIT